MYEDYFGLKVEQARCKLNVQLIVLAVVLLESFFSGVSSIELNTVEPTAADRRTQSTERLTGCRYQTSCPKQPPKLCQATS